MSIILRPPSRFKSLSMIPPIIAIAAVRILTRIGINAKIKWPNDVTLNDRKLAGILCESKVVGGKVRWIIAGIGMNVNNKPPLLTRQHSNGAISLSIVTGTKIDLASLSRAIRDETLNIYSELMEVGTEPILQEYNALHSLRGRRIRLHLANGEIDGDAEEMDSEGRLKIAMNGRKARFRAENVLRVDYA